MFISPISLLESHNLTLTWAPLSISDSLIIIPGAHENKAFTSSTEYYSYMTNIDPNCKQTWDPNYLVESYSIHSVSQRNLSCTSSQQAVRYNSIRSLPYLLQCNNSPLRVTGETRSCTIINSINYNYDKQKPYTSSLWNTLLRPIISSTCSSEALSPHIKPSGFEQIDVTIDPRSTIPSAPGPLCLPEEYLFARGNKSESWGLHCLDWKRCAGFWPEDSSC